MANKRTEKTPARKAITRRPRAEKKVQAKTPQYRSSFFSISESYTSLILGIIVVILTALLLVAFIRNQPKSPVQEPNKDIITALKDTSLSASPSSEDNKQVTPTLTVAVSDTPTPTQKIIPTNTPAISPTTTTAPTVTTAPEVEKSLTQGKVDYTTKAGDDLWVIAEKFYNSGYNWVDIAKANNLTNPNILHSGVKLIIPKVEKKLATVSITPIKEATPMSDLNNPQAPKTYTVKPGDDLWDVAVNVYKDGYRWVDIAKANNLTNPNVIHPGNTLKIPEIKK